MRILIVNQHVQDVIGGSEIHSDIAACELYDRGHDVLYAVCRPRQQSYDTPYRCIGIGRSFARSFARIVRDFRPNIIYWEANKPNLLVATLIAKRYRCKFVFHISHISDTKRWIAAGTRVFNNVDHNAPLLKRLAQSIMYIQWPLRSAWNYNGYYLIDGAISTQDELSGLLPVRRERKIYYAVPVHDEPVTWPRPFVLWAARIQRKKNPEEYIALARHFAGSGVDFLLAGEIQDKNYDYLHDQAQLPANLHYIGLQSPEQINGLLANALVLVHTCNPEGFGLIYIQAWLHGKPTVSLYHDPEGLIARQGFGFVSHTQQQMQADVGRLLADDDLRGEMGTRAFEFARDNFTTEANGAGIESFLQEICAA